jgi:hypothetical protein
MGYVHEDKTGFAELTFSFPFSIGSSTTTWAAGKIGFIMLHFLGPLMRSIDQD